MRLLLLPLVLSACAGKGEDTSTAPPLDTDTAADECTGHAPVVTEVTAVNGGMRTFEGTSLPSFLITVTATDEDLDLDRMTINLWWDTTVDGTVSIERTPDVTGSPIVIRDLPCGVSQGSSGLYLPMQSGGALEFATQYEVAGVAIDAHGTTSEAAGIGSGWTPNEDGSDGGS
jgi:hypothetical protein